MAKNTATIAATDFDAMKAALAEKQKADLAAVKGMEFHMVTVTGGRKFPEGTTGECTYVGINRRFGGKLNARVIIDGKAEFIDPAHLEKGKPLSAARKAVIEAEREADKNATVLIDGYATRVTDGKGDKGGAVQIRNSGWFGPIWFAKEHVTVRGAYTPDGSENELTVYEVPQWKVRKDAGQVALDAAIARQPSLIPHCNDLTEAEIAEFSNK